MKNKDNLNQILLALPFSVRSLIKNLPNNLTEIRLRCGRPITLLTDTDRLFMNTDGSLSQSLTDKAFILSYRELGECFNIICDYSVYSKQNEIINGFITLKGGNRAGISGTAIIDNGKITNIRDISSINIRVACERIGCAEAVLNAVDNSDSVLLCGAPKSGKTTILRDIARVKSKDKTVSLIDSRGELAAVYAGVPQNNVGMCDILDAYSRGDGFDHAVRCLSPDLIICDEIGNENDAREILRARECGVFVTASAHCSDLESLRKRSELWKLVQSGIFENVVFLGTGESLGQITDVYCYDDLI